MKIRSSFSVPAPPDRVYEFLLDVNRVAACVPGAQVAEVVDPDTFQGKVRIKVGPVTVAYQGVARVTARSSQDLSATLEAEGREATGSGSARAITTMSVHEDAQGSTVTLDTDLTVVGRVAQFGRGIMEDVARHLVNEMGECIRAKLAGEAGSSGATGTEPEPTVERADARAPLASPTSTPSAAEGGETSAPLDVLALARAVVGAQVRRARHHSGWLAAGGILGAVVTLCVCRRPCRRG